MTTPRRRRKRRMSGRGFAWLAVLGLALWPTVAMLAGEKASWPMVLGSAVASAVMVRLLTRPRRRRITTLPKSNMAKPVKQPARPNGMKVLRPLTEEPKLPTRQTRTRDKLAAAQELAFLHGYGEELKGAWDALEVTDATTADVVTQREVEEYPLLDAHQKLERWLADSDAKHRREAS